MVRRCAGSLLTQLRARLRVRCFVAEIREFVLTGIEETPSLSTMVRGCGQAASLAASLCAGNLAMPPRAKGEVNEHAEEAALQGES
jgi:hypothetical protein